MTCRKQVPWHQSKTLTKRRYRVPRAGALAHSVKNSQTMLLLPEDVTTYYSIKVTHSRVNQVAQIGHLKLIYLNARLTEELGIIYLCLIVVIIYFQFMLETPALPL